MPAVLFPLSQNALRAVLLGSFVLTSALAARADPVPGISVEQAYALIRDTMLDFDSPPDAMLKRFASQPGGSWDTLPLTIDFPDDPQAMRLRAAMEYDSAGNGYLAARQLDCTRLGPAGLAAVNDGQPVMPSQVLGATPDASFDAMAEAMAMPALAYAAQELAPKTLGAVMMCTMTIALSDGADGAELQALAGEDFETVHVAPEGAVYFTAGKPGPEGTIAQIIVSVSAVDGQRFLYLSAFSLSPDPAS